MTKFVGVNSVRRADLEVCNTRIKELLENFDHIETVPARLMTDDIVGSAIGIDVLLDEG